MKFQLWNLQSINKYPTSPLVSQTYTPPLTSSRYPNTIIDGIFVFIRFLLAHNHSTEGCIHSRSIRAQDVHALVRPVISRRQIRMKRLRNCPGSFAAQECGVSPLFPDQGINNGSCQSALGCPRFPHSVLPNFNLLP